MFILSHLWDESLESFIVKNDLMPMKQRFVQASIGKKWKKCMKEWGIDEFVMLVNSWKKTGFQEMLKIIDNLKEPSNGNKRRMCKINYQSKLSINQSLDTNYCSIYNLTSGWVAQFLVSSLHGIVLGSIFLRAPLKFLHWIGSYWNPHPLQPSSYKSFP